MVFLGVKGSDGFLTVPETADMQTIRILRAAAVAIAERLRIIILK
jgi:hypothetical protein